MSIKFEDLPSIETVRDRLKIALKKANLRKVELARRCDTSPQTVNNWFRSKTLRYIHPFILPKLAKALNVSEDWLRDGVGEMERRDFPDVHFCVPSFKNGFLEFVRDDKKLPPMQIDSAFFTARNTTPEGFKTILAQDDAMSPMIKKDDFIIIDTNADVVSDKIYLLRVKENLTCRRIIKTLNEDLIARAECRDYPEEQLTEGVEIVGRVYARLSFY